MCQGVFEHLKCSKSKSLGESLRQRLAFLDLSVYLSVCLSSLLDIIWFNGLFGPRIFTIVNLKQRPTTLTMSYATLAQALHVSCCISLINYLQSSLFTSNS